MARKAASTPAPNPAIDWVSIIAQALIAMALLTLLAVGLRAAPVNLSDPAVREQALQAHRDRVATLLEQRRQERLEQSEEMQEMDQEGQYQRQQAERTAARESAQEIQQIRGGVQLLCDPLNITTQMGSPFVTGVVLKNLGGSPVDRIRIGLVYDPEVVEPVRISDHRLRPLLASQPEVSGDPNEGLILYSATLENQHTGTNLEVLTIEWEPIVPAPRSRISLVSAGDHACSVMAGGQSILGERGNAGGGVIGTEFAVRPREGGIRESLLIDSVESLQNVLGVRIRGEVGLSLMVSSDGPPQVGDILPIDIALNNEAGNPIDDVRFTLAYDPRVFEILDAAPTEERRPGANWIVGGVNLHDAPFQDDYRYNFLLQNEVDNELGRARYHMGLDEARVLPSGTLARFYLKALAPAERTAVAFVHGNGLGQPMTAVRCLGVDLLGDAEVSDDGTSGILLPVLATMDEDAVAAAAPMP